MNLVAHQLLSFENPAWQVGNHLGEEVKGKQYLNFEPPIQKGILLHRFIDSNTDQNPIVKNSSSYFHENYGKYSPVIVDIFYDYFLIKNWSQFTNKNFDDFTDEVYSLLLKNKALYQPKLLQFTEAMVKYDWFHMYSNLDGLEQILKGISSRTKFQNKMYEAVKDLYIFEDALETDFLQFFPEIKEKCRQFLFNNLNSEESI